MRDPCRALAQILVLCLLLVWPAVTAAQWTVVGDGIEYDDFTTADPNNLFVARMARSNLNATIEDVGVVRTISKYGRELKTCTVVLTDKTGKIDLTLWNDLTGKFKKGDKVAIKNAYVNSWQDKAQLTLGKFGTMELAK